MPRYTAYYHRDDVFFVSEMIVAMDDEEAILKARIRGDELKAIQPAAILAQLDRHVTVFVREKQDA